MSASFPKCNQAGIEFVISTNEELREESMFLSEEFPIAIHKISSMRPRTPFRFTGTMNCRLPGFPKASWNTASTEINSNWEAISLCWSRATSSTVPTPPPAT